MKDKLHSKEKSIKYLSEWMDTNIIEKNECIVRFGMAIAINSNDDNYRIRDIDLYVSPKMFKNLKNKNHISTFCPTKNNFKSCYKIEIIESDYPVIEIFECHELENIEYLYHDGIKIATIEQTQKDYTNLGKLPHKKD